MERRELAGLAAEELRGLVQEGIDSGPSRLATMADVKAEARQRFLMHRKIELDTPEPG